MSPLILLAPVPLLGFFNLQPMELLLLAGLALLIFGRRLPEVGRSLGKGIVEFKKGLAGVEDEVGRSGQSQTPPANAQPPQRQEPPALPPASAPPQNYAQDPQSTGQQGQPRA